MPVPNARQAPKQRGKSSGMGKGCLVAVVIVGFMSCIGMSVLYALVAKSQRWAQQQQQWQQGSPQYQNQPQTHTDDDSDSSDEEDEH